MSGSAGGSGGASHEFSLERLNLSANAFTAKFDSLIPASFGPRKTEHQRQTEFNEALQRAAIGSRDDLLGLGHPDVGKRSGLGLDNLQRRLGKLDKGKGTGKPVDTDGAEGVDKSLGSQKGVANKNGEEESSDEEESRSRMVGKGKRKAFHVDLTAPKKKKSNVLVPSTSLADYPSSLGPTSSDPLLLKSDPSSLEDTSSRPAERVNEHFSPSDQQLLIPPDDGGTGPHTPNPNDSFPFDGPIALDSPQAKRILAQKIESPMSLRTSKLNGLDPKRKATIDDIPVDIFANAELSAPSDKVAIHDDNDVQRGPHVKPGPDTDIAQRNQGSEGRLTKNQRKRERAKRARQIQQQIHGQKMA